MFHAITHDQLDQMDRYNSFEFWFNRISDSYWSVNSIAKDESGHPYVSGYSYRSDLDIVYDAQEGDIDNDVADRIKKDFIRFKTTRPEYLVGEEFCLEGLSHSDYVNLYESLLVGVAFIRAAKNGCDPDSAMPKLWPCIDWLRKSDFYEAPASTIYHESYRGGLLYHTLCVVTQIKDCRKINKFQNVPLENAVLVALIHDWCKIGLYESYTKNVKNEKTGQWEQVLAYKRTDPMIPLGHGVGSLFLARGFFKLSVEESLAIRWHMGEYNVAHNEMNELHAANEKYPLVQLLQFADRLSITKY